MMSLLNNNNKNKNGKKLIWAAPLIVFFLTLIIFNASARNSVSSVLFSVATPFLKGERFVRNWWQNSGYFFSTKKNLFDENTALKEKNAELENKLLFFDVLKEETDQFKSLLSQKKAEDYIFASTIVRPPQSPYDIVIVDAGLKNGAQKGMEVFVYDNALIGRVEGVFQTVSKIKLISYPGEKTNAFLQRNNLAVIVNGKGGGNMEIELPNSIEVRSGDLVIGAGTFPALLGAVERVEINLSNPFQKIFFRLPINLHEIRSVLIKKVYDEKIPL